jgi:DNA-binding PadR family transcriptional regulator
MNDLLVLAHLLGGPLHGYALKKQIGFLLGQPEMHNNLVYPLLRSFEKKGWISRRAAAGERGQTRAMYALRREGKRELLRRLSKFTEKDASVDNAFRIRVGMFDILDDETRRRILDVREAWLAARHKRLAKLSGVLDAGPWGTEVLIMIGRQILSERSWIWRLKRRVRAEQQRV